MFKIRKVKNKIKIRRRLKKDAAAAAANVAHEVVGLVSLERVISVNTLTASMGNMSVQQGTRGVDRGRHQSFFALNAPQGNPFAAAGAASMPFPSNIQQQPFTGQYFEPPAGLERVCKVCSFDTKLAARL
ncbi:mei2-like protein [Fusarium pseudoanthophilum]|uniref:Mei2-like protein n=1 Tax=Fusarium pseudoanthophilum TaxID=48495 RepID=A0A8H5P0P0_9HYPO|nr:mei2-like protein [Fusarium pseudoanthophilum]